MSFDEPCQECGDRVGDETQGGFVGDRCYCTTCLTRQLEAAWHTLHKIKKLRDDLEKSDNYIDKIEEVLDAAGIPDKEIRDGNEVRVMALFERIESAGDIIRGWMKLDEEDTVLAAWAEKASGPGWTNALYWVAIRDKSQQVRIEPIQPEEQTKTMHTLHALSAEMTTALRHEIEQLRNKKSVEESSISTAHESTEIKKM